MFCVVPDLLGDNIDLLQSDYVNNSSFTQILQKITLNY